MKPTEQKQLTGYLDSIRYYITQIRTMNKQLLNKLDNKQLEDIAGQQYLEALGKIDNSCSYIELNCDDIQTQSVVALENNCIIPE